VRVAIFTDNDFDAVSGATTTLKAVLRFAPDDVRPRIYTAADFEVDTLEFFAAPSFGMGLPHYREMRMYWPRRRAFARQLQADGTSVVHIATPGPVGLAGRCLAARLGLPVMGSYHAHLAEHVETLSRSRRVGRLLERYLRWFYGCCLPLLVPSRATRDLLATNCYAPDRLRVWARGVDTSRFTPARASSALRNGWHVDDRRPAVIYAGRLSREKGLALVAPIERLLHRDGVAHQFIGVGDGPMLAEMREACPDAVISGAVPHDQVAVAMASADVFLFPSATDALGTVVLEAQASGLPALVSDRGGPQEQIRPGITGDVCRTGDAEDFARKLAALLRNAQRRREMGRHARQLALCRDWPAALQPLFDAWREAASRIAPVPNGFGPNRVRSSASAHTESSARAITRLPPEPPWPAIE
jgi:glycosyltransferase involved in cell wall biosynthesis